MPWRGPEFDGEKPSLGGQIGEWIEAYCVIPDLEHKGEPYRLTDEMWNFLLHHYRVREDALEEKPRSAFFYRRSQLVRPQKWGKGPFSAALICAEAVGPTYFGGWDANGDPVGKAWSTPLIQVTAASEEQAGNVYDALLPMIQEGDLSLLIPDAGQTRINIPGGGRIEPVTAAARSRLGQRVTFVVQDETGTWTEGNGGQKLADTQRRGLAGMGGRAIETTNAWDPMENSVAQRTFESSSMDVYRDFRQAPASLSYGNRAERRRIHKAVYGDSWWIDLDRIDAEAMELAERDPAQAERFFGNRLVQGLGAYLEPELLDTRIAKPSTERRICLGFDGSSSSDWTALRAETVDGFRFTPTYTVGDEERPAVWDPSTLSNGRIDRAEVRAAVEQVFKRYDVERMYCDPRDWQTEIDDWALQYGEKVVVQWPTNQISRMFAGLDRYRADMVEGSTRHSDDKVWKIHALNARKVAKPGDKYILGKPAEHQKIDVLMADVLAHEAAADSRAAGWANAGNEYVYLM